jgi:hypothetical protein
MILLHNIVEILDLSDRKMERTYQKLNKLENFATEPKKPQKNTSIY